MKKITFRLLAASIGAMLFLSACSAEQGSKEQSSENASASASLSVSAGSSNESTSSIPGAGAPSSSVSRVSESFSRSKLASSSSQIPQASSASVVPPASSKPVSTAQMPATQSQAPQVPAPEPQSKPAPAPTPASEPAPPPPVPEPAFDVNAWVNLGISYGQSIGLEADSSVTGSWDNPIVAGPNSQYLERDICGMLDWYKASGVTRFWVWSSPRGDGKYDIYIGYS